MTIQFQGHIESVARAGAPADHVAITCITDSGVCPKGIVVNVPEKDAVHWLVGRMVSITMYAFDAPQQGKPNPNASPFSQMDEVP
jgi:hypothetical protein